MSTNKVFLGNLSWSVTSESLADLLRNEGYTFESAKVITDRETGRSRGFAFVQFETSEAATEAIAGLNGHEIGGRFLRAMEAIDSRHDRPNCGEGGRDRSGYGGDSCDDRGHFDGSGRRREHHRSRRHNNDGD